MDKQNSGTLKFDPSSFLLVPTRRFEDLKVGDIFRAPSRTLTDAHASAFQAVSADNHPIHYDSVWAARHGHAAPVVHGLQVLAFTAPGATLFPHYIGEVFIAFTELSCKFLKEVRRRYALSRTGDRRAHDRRLQRTGDGKGDSVQSTRGTCALRRAQVSAEGLAGC